MFYRFAPRRNVDRMKKKIQIGMKTAILYPYLALNNRQICCVTFHARQAAIFSAIYTMVRVSLFYHMVCPYLMFVARRRSSAFRIPGIYPTSFLYEWF